MESLVQGQLARRVRWGGCRNVRSERNEARWVLTQSLPVGAFTAADVVDVYLHRGANARVLSDEDQEQDPDRWCSQTRLLAGGLANPLTVGLESAPLPGASTPSHPEAHHGVCSRTSIDARGCCGKRPCPA